MQEWKNGIEARYLTLRLFLIAMLWFPGTTPFAQASPFVACSLPLPPHTMPAEDGRPDGYATKILQAVARELGWTLDIVYMPWLRLVEQAKHGQCDIAYTALNRSDYREFLIFPQEAVLESANILLVQRDSGIRYHGDLEQFMRSHSIGLYRDKAVSEEFEQLRQQDWAQIEYCTTARQNLEKLISGRFDAAIENNFTAVYELKKIGRFAEVEILQPPLNINPVYITFPQRGRLADQVDRFDQALKVYKAGDAFRQLSLDYFAEQ